MPIGIPIILLIIVAIIVIRCIRIVPQSSTYIIETLGKYSATWEAGLHLKTPIISKVVNKISMKEQVADFEPQVVITADNVSMSVDSVVYFYVFDPKSVTYAVERPIAALENLSATTLRNIIGSMTLDDTLTSRDSINGQITKILDEATDKWGIKVTRVEVKNITPPRSIQDAMERQMKAEREKREAILRAEGDKTAAITRAEGEKEAAILRADAVREQRVREAKGEADAVRMLAEAKAAAVEMINQVKPSKEYLSIRSMEAAEEMARGQATKLIVPSDFQNVAATVAAIRETANQEQVAE